MGVPQTTRAKLSNCVRCYANGGPGLAGLRYSARITRRVPAGAGVQVGGELAVDAHPSGRHVLGDSLGGHPRPR